MVGFSDFNKYYQILIAKNRKRNLLLRKKSYRHLDITKPMVALTFDDGPHPIYTQRILETLTKYKSVATFFMLGTRAEAYPNQVNLVNTQGSQIGNHSWDHKQLTKLNSIDVKNEVSNTQRAVYNATKKVPEIIRPPYGSINTELKQQLNMPIILWNIDTQDWKSKNTASIVSKALENVQDGDIILMHDIYKTTADAVPYIITELKSRGFELVTITELLSNKGSVLQNNTTYTRR
ncbi:MAG: polysaccharide deacetylase family protein [Clostridia bacterium]